MSRKNVKHRHESQVSMYFRLDTPLESRKEILKTAIYVTQLSKKYESFKGIRHLRTEAYQNFKDVFYDLENLIKKLKNKDLPVIERIKKDIRKAKLAENMTVVMEKHEQIKDTGKAGIQEEIVNKPEIHISDEDKLDKELKEIQNKLRNLDAFK